MNNAVKFKKVQNNVKFERVRNNVKLKIYHLFKPLTQINIPDIRLIPLNHVTLRDLNTFFM